jgi:hypothetical protein
VKIRNFTFSGCKDSHKNFWAPPIETARDGNRRSLARGINPASSIFRALTWKSWSQNTYQCRFVQLYNSCSGSTSHRGYDPFQQSYAAGDWKLQNARPAPYCLYSQAAGQSYFPPKGNCFGYVANEWMTFQIHFKLGPRFGDEFLNSYVNMWIAREDQPSELVFNWGPYNLSGGGVENGRSKVQKNLVPAIPHREKTSPRFILPGMSGTKNRSSPEKRFRIPTSTRRDKIPS